MSTPSRLSGSDAIYLYLESATQPMHVGSIIILEGEAKFEEIYSHYEERIHLDPAYQR